MAKSASVTGETGDLFGRQGAVLTGAESFIELDRAHAQAVQTDDLVLEVAEHALDLMVATFVEGQAGLARGENLQVGGPGEQILEAKVQAAGEDLDAGRVDRGCGIDQIDLGLFAGRGGYPARPLAV